MQQEQQDGPIARDSEAVPSVVRSGTNPDVSTPFGHGWNDMHVSIVVRQGLTKTETRIEAYGLSSRDPLPYLRAAIAALQAEIDGYSRCPMHSGAARDG